MRDGLAWRACAVTRAKNLKNENQRGFLDFFRQKPA